MTTEEHIVLTQEESLLEMSPEEEETLRNETASMLNGELNDVPVHAAPSLVDITKTAIVGLHQEITDELKTVSDLMQDNVDCQCDRLSSENDFLQKREDILAKLSKVTDFARELIDKQISTNNAEISRLRGIKRERFEMENGSEYEPDAKEPKYTIINE